MPLIASPAVYTPPTPGPGAGPQPLQLTYTDPDGNIWYLSDPSSGLFVTAVAGIGSPPVALTSLPLPYGGVLAQALTPQIRPIVVGLYMYNDDGDQYSFLGLRDRLTRALWTIRAGQPAPGILTVTRPDGTARQISVYCTDGPSMASDDATKSGLTWTSMVVTFQAADPYWYDAAPRSIIFGSSSAAGVPPMPPVALAPPVVLGGIALTNDGDADCYPIWTITGPGQPTLTNNTTGLAFSISATLGSSDVYTIDTRPTQQSVVDQTGANQWAHLVASSPRSLWPLVPGSNSLTLTMTGASSGSQIQLSYTRRWLRA